MLVRTLRHPFACSPLLAIVAQLVLAAVAAASTGGGDFPVH